MAPAQIVQQTSFATLSILCASSTSDEIKFYASYNSTKYEYSTCTEKNCKDVKFSYFYSQGEEKIHIFFKVFGKCKFQGS